MSLLGFQTIQNLWIVLDWLFPPVCAGCGQSGFRWCPDCSLQVKQVAEPFCIICGLPLSHSNICSSCKNSVPPFKALRSWAVYDGPVRLAVHSIKYRQNIALGHTFGSYLAGYVIKLGWQVDVVVPVPLGRQRLKERGYNQAGLLARPFSSIRKWQYSPKAIWRVRETRSQVGLSPKERKENLSNAFRADPVRVAGKVILLMDDVATTGATLSACSEALLNAGANAVYALTLARALPHHGLLII